MSFKYRNTQECFSSITTAIKLILTCDIIARSTTHSQHNTCTQSQRAHTHMLLSEVRSVTSRV